MKSNDLNFNELEELQKISLIEGILLIKDNEVLRFYLNRSYAKLGLKKKLLMQEDKVRVSKSLHIKSIQDVAKEEKKYNINYFGNVEKLILGEYNE